MGLDIYVGPLSRYYGRSWRTIVQQAAGESGMECVIVRANQSEETVSSDDAQKVVLEWRQQLARALGIELEWNESVNGEYYTDKPAWDCYWALVLHASIEMFPGAKRRWWSSKEPHQHPAYRKARATVDGRYSQLVSETEFWLPIGQNLLFRGQSVQGIAVGFGTTYALLRQLEELNQRTWRAETGELEHWMREGADVDADEDVKARFAFAVMHSLAFLACKHRLPMLLDY